MLTGHFSCTGLACAHHDFLVKLLTLPVRLSVLQPCMACLAQPCSPGVKYQCFKHMGLEYKIFQRKTTGDWLEWVLTSVHSQLHQHLSATLRKSCKSPLLLVCQVLPETTQASNSTVQVLPASLALTLICQEERSQSNPTAAHPLHKLPHTPAVPHQRKSTQS